MTDSTEELRALLERERETDRPPAEVVEHGWARLEAAVRTGLPADPDPDLALDAVPSGAGSAAIGSTKLTVALVAMVAGGVATWAATRESDAPASIDASEPQVPADRAGAAEAMPPPEPADPAHGKAIDLEETVDETTDEATAPQRKPAPRSRGDRKADSTNVDALAAELGLVQAAQRALSDGNPARALELARRHGRLHAGGALVEERRAIEALALCDLGRPRGPDVALQFQRTYPRSTHIDRVRAACLTPEALPEDEE